MEAIITTLTTGVTGVFSIAGQGFEFITGNDLCMFMVNSIAFLSLEVKVTDTA